MDDPFELVDPQDAQRFLRVFSAEARRKGEACFRRECVSALKAETPGTDYSAVVEDGEEREVSLCYQEGSGWQGSCTCQQAAACEHLYAAMSALLAEHRAASVRGLSSGMRSALARLAEARWKQKAAGNRESSELAERLQAAKGQKLSRQELSFLLKVHEVYTRCRQRRQITYWDFQEMGLPLKNYSWAELKIWPSFPKDEYEFWLYVANALRERELRIPEFMAPVTDFALIDERLTRWRRTQEVEEWRQKLHRLLQEPSSPGSISNGAIDLRVVLRETEAQLEWRLLEKAGPFERLRQFQFKKLMTSEEQGFAQFTPEAESIWQVFRYGFDFEPQSTISYRESKVLNRLLRMQTLASRIVTSSGKPLERPAEPLHWEMHLEAGAEKDYLLHLVQADGSPAPPVLAVLAGNPTLYLTPDALFTGPPTVPSVLEPGQENRIPAAAIDNREGVRFLQSLGVALPASLRERVRTLPYEIAITCDLRPDSARNDGEECVIRVVAEAPDGQQATLTSAGWQESPPKAQARREGETEEIILYDSTGLREIPQLLEPLNLKLPAYGDTFILRVTKRFPELFSSWLKSLPPSILVQLKGELASLTNATVAGRVTLEATEAEIDWFDLRVALTVGDTTLTPAEIRLLLNAKGGYVRLKGKGWRRLEFELSEEEQERLARLGVSPRELSAEPQRLHALQLADEAAKKFLPDHQVDRIQRRAEELKARVSPPVPALVKADLRPYQLDGFHFLAYLSVNRFGGILADDMGLGKTLQALAWLVWLREERLSKIPPKASGEGGLEDSRRPAASRPESTAVLVVCPKSVMDNWHAEAERFVPSLRVKVWSAGDLDHFGAQLGEADVHVVNYSQLRLLTESLTTLRWLAVILDEGQYIKNPNSQTAQIARGLHAEHRLILSGTPIENRLTDLWSLMAFAMPGILGSRAQFGRLYEGKGDPFARRRLAARVRPFVLRRTKGQVAKDLPDRIEEDLFCEIEGEQETLYRAELKRAQQLLLGIRTQQELAQHQFHFLTSLLRLRQVCCHPRLMKPDSTATSAKTEALMEQLGPLMEEGQKVLVFSQFVEMLNLLQPRLLEQGWPIFYLSGQTENRGELVRQFQSAEGAAVFLISLKAGGFGLNLTAASYVILFDPWWNPAVESQAIDRTHRIGQRNHVIAYRLLIKNSIEEKIRALQKQKKALAHDVLGEEKFAQSLTLQDLKFLFAD